MLTTKTLSDLAGKLSPFSAKKPKLELGQRRILQIANFLGRFMEVVTARPVWMHQEVLRAVVKQKGSKLSKVTSSSKTSRMNDATFNRPVKTMCVC